MVWTGATMAKGRNDPSILRSIGYDDDDDATTGRLAAKDPLYTRRVVANAQSHITSPRCIKTYALG
jgi:hypothetical protein